MRLLGGGELKTKASFVVHGASKSAIAAVEKLGGTVQVLYVRPEPKPEDKKEEKKPGKKAESKEEGKKPEQKKPDDKKPAAKKPAGETDA